MGLRRGHDLIGIGGDEALPERALAEISRHHGRPALGGGGEEALLRIEPQAGLAGAGIRAVAMEAGVRQDGPDVAIEAHRFGGASSGGERAPRQERGQNPGWGRDRPEEHTRDVVGWLHEDCGIG